MENLRNSIYGYYEKIKKLLNWGANINPIKHSSRLGSITGLEVIFQKVMHEFLTSYGASPITGQVFEITSTCLYIFFCLLMVTKCGVHFYFEAKKEIVESQKDSI